MEDTLLVKIVKANCTSEQKGKHRKIRKLSPDFFLYIYIFYIFCILKSGRCVLVLFYLKVPCHFQHYSSGLSANFE